MAYGVMAYHSMQEFSVVPAGLGILTDQSPLC
jgi:hypothetical protein